MKGESVVVSGLQRGEESEKEDGASEKVENAIEYHLVIDRHHVRTLGEGPADRVQHPDDDEVDSAAAVYTLVRFEQARPQSAE